MKIFALLDSNVVIAAVAQAHEHHPSSLALFTDHDPAAFAIAAHSYAEAYNTLTRRDDRAPFQRTPREAWAALESLRAVTALVGLTPARTFDTVRDFANGGGVGARLYDRLIGETAVAESISAILTWNVSHMRSLFPGLEVHTPAEFHAAHG
ncbi:MAG TPA: PIN domain-containing protein [Caulobacteraceae bacterium]|nr:PIN domain-containing protein [Caulobacteraceae bacterium]